MGLWGCGQRACVVHISTGLRRLEHFARCPITQSLVRPLIVVEVQPPTDATTRLRHGGVDLDIGEWRGASQPRALSEPDVNLSIHPAPIIQPLVPRPNGRTGSGRAAEANVASPRPPACALGTVCICEIPIAR